MYPYQKYDKVHEIIVNLENPDRWMEAGNYILVNLCGQPPLAQNEQDGKEACNAHFFSLLDNDNYLMAAVMAWGLDGFDPRPKCVRRIFKAIKDENKLMLQGASSLSKTFSASVWILLDWCRDPEHTAVRLASMSEMHLKNNLFSSIIRLWRSSAIKLPGQASAALFLGLDPNSGNSCIRGITFPKDDNITGRFLSFKFYNRTPVHPVFGKTSRLRIFLDEFNKISPGVIRDLNSVVASMFDKEHIKIITAYNPADTSHASYQLAEPEVGWGGVDPDKDWRWKSKRGGWQIERLDGMQCENVIENKVLYPGFLTKEAYDGYQTHGDNSADYWTYGRGWFPMTGAHNTIINLHSLNVAKRIPIYLKNVTEMASVDTAMINDKTWFTKYRYGQAIGWIKQNGEKEYFGGDINKQEIRWIVYLDDWAIIPGAKDEWELAGAIAETCKSHNVAPKWTAVDATGAGHAIKNALLRIFGDVFGVNWVEGCSDKKMVLEDTEGPEGNYSTVNCEMWFTFKRWIEGGIIFINPKLDTEKLFDQLTTRRQRANKVSAGKVQVESKAEWRSRAGHGESPDAADSAIQITQLIRHRHEIIPSIGKAAVDAKAATASGRTVWDEWRERFKPTETENWKKHGVEDNQPDDPENDVQNESWSIEQELGGSSPADEEEEVFPTW